MSAEILPHPLSEGPFAVETRGLCRRYGRLWALVDVALSVPRGSITLVAGHNGSGKSTLFRVLGGALRPDRGEVRVGGFDAVRERTQLRSQVALLSHQSFTYEALSALQNLQIFARLSGCPAERGPLLERLAEVGLSGRADDAVQTFSAGMRKRLAFARVLVQRPSVVLLDEPYGQLDPQGFAFVDALFERLRRERTTVLVASHLLEHVSSFCDHGIVLERGRLVWRGEARDLPGWSRDRSPVATEGRA